MNKLAIAAAAALVCTGADAFTPATGQWYNPDESGSGYNIDVQNGKLVMTVFSYKTNGDSEWYITAGAMSNGQKSYSGSLRKVRNGQSIGGAYQAPTDAGSEGDFSITFSDETSATLSLPNGRTTRIQPFNFGFGAMPQAMVGEWVFTENIGSAWFADHYTFSFIDRNTPNGVGGAVQDGSQIAACELQSKGDPSVIGKVICGHFTSSGALIEGYLFRLGLDQTYEGIYILPSGLGYPMKGYMTASSSAPSSGAVPYKAKPISDGTVAAKLAAHQDAASYDLSSSPLLGALHALGSRLGS
jgi:hypothetical protein